MAQVQRLVPLSVLRRTVRRMAAARSLDEAESVALDLLPIADELRGQIEQEVREHVTRQLDPAMWRRISEQILTLPVRDDQLIAAFFNGLLDGVAALLDSFDEEFLVNFVVAAVLAFGVPLLMLVGMVVGIIEWLVQLGEELASFIENFDLEEMIEQSVRFFLLLMLSSRGPRLAERMGRSIVTELQDRLDEVIRQAEWYELPVAFGRLVGPTSLMAALSFTGVGGAAALLGRLGVTMPRMARVMASAARIIAQRDRDLGPELDDVDDAVKPRSAPALAARRAEDGEGGESVKGRAVPVDALEFLREFYGARTWSETIVGDAARNRLGRKVLRARGISRIIKEGEKSPHGDYVELALSRDLARRADRLFPLEERDERTPDFVMEEGGRLSRTEMTHVIPQAMKANAKSTEELAQRVQRMTAGAAEELLEERLRAQLRHALKRAIREKAKRGQLRAELFLSDGRRVPPGGRLQVAVPRLEFSHPDRSVRVTVDSAKVRDDVQAVLSELRRQDGPQPAGKDTTVEVFSVSGRLDEAEVHHLGGLP